MASSSRLRPNLARGRSPPAVVTRPPALRSCGERNGNARGGRTGNRGLGAGSWPADAGGENPPVVLEAAENARTVASLDQLIGDSRGLVAVRTQVEQRLP